LKIPEELGEGHGPGDGFARCAVDEMHDVLGLNEACVCERERERERECVCVHIVAYTHTHTHTHTHTYV
jgi:hypothetical protein